MDSMSDLKALSAGAFHCVQLLGYYAPGDGGGGEFFWDASSTELDNGGTIIMPTSTPAKGRWQRVAEGPLSVKWLGAKGDGTTDDTAAIQAAINALTSKALGSQAGIVLLPPGSYLVTSTLLISNAVGISFSGLGQQATTLIPSCALSGKPVIKLVNCVNCAVKDLWIQGNTSARPSAGIESLVDHPSAIALYPTNLLVRDVLIGFPAFGSVLSGLGYGIRFTATEGSDGDNDESTISHVTLAGIATAGISIEHSNSLVHKFDNLRIYYVPIGIQTQGGSFQLVNSFFSVSDVEFNFLAPQGNLNGVATAGYYHPILISNTTSEGTSDLLRTAPWPAPGTPRKDGVTGIHIYLSNFGQKGTKAGSQGKLDTSINYESPGRLSITNSHLNFGTDTNIVAPNPKSVVTLSGNYLSAVHQIQYGGHLTSVGNFWTGGAAEFAPLPGAAIETLGDFNDFPSATN
jgi:hypothetical protein